MPYEPTQGVIVNGAIIDADDLANEFQAISLFSKEVETKVDNNSQAAIDTSKKYTDAQVAGIIVDGGTF